MSTLNSLGPRHLPFWLMALVMSLLALLSVIFSGHFQANPQWVGVLIYIVSGFIVVVLSFRPAWGQPAFWLATSVLVCLHVVIGTVIAIFLPRFTDTTHSFLTIIVLADLLLTMSIIWRVTIRGRHKRQDKLHIKR